MAIEGPLRELGIHDVFQLLDLSRKTGTLRVISELRDNEGTVYFDKGRVLHAVMRSNPHPLGTILLRAGKISEADLAHARALQTQHGDARRLGEILVDLGAITARELERQVRFQIESVVFELMSWREGFFSFEERSVEDAPVEATIRISTESLLMEGARRIDEWSRIADKVPHLGVIPVLAAVDEDHPTLLDLLPNEWEVLTIIDGERDLRAIAAVLGRSEFDIAKIAYGLVSTGVIELHASERTATGAAYVGEDPQPLLEFGAEALAAGRLDEAYGAARRAVAADGRSAEARRLLARILVRMGRHGEGIEEFRRAIQLDPLNSILYLELGYAAVNHGDLPEAIASWKHFLSMNPAAPEAPRVKAAIDSAVQLQAILDSHAHV